MQVANAYGAGLTDWDQSSLYGKLCIFAFAAWGGQNDGVIAGLAVCGIMLSVTSAACGELADWDAPRTWVKNTCLSDCLAIPVYLLFMPAFRPCCRMGAA